MHPGNWLKSSLHFKAAFPVCFHVQWIGTDFVQCDDVSDVTLRTPKHTYSELRPSPGLPGSPGPSAFCLLLVSAPTSCLSCISWVSFVMPRPAESFLVLLLLNKPLVENHFLVPTSGLHHPPDTNTTQTKYIKWFKCQPGTWKQKIHGATSCSFFWYHLNLPRRESFTSVGGFPIQKRYKIQKKLSPDHPLILG